MKRFCIFVLYDKDGNVKDYVLYYLKSLQQVVQKILVTVNGKLSEEGRLKLQELNVDILVRENNGLDFGAWKDAVKQTGINELAKYDELILANDSVYGALFPFNVVFNEMKNRKCDFWGITKHPHTGENIIKNDNKTKIIEHIQSYFLVFNNKVITSESFKQWWDSIEYHNNYDIVVGYYETKLTKFFEDKGFTSDSYINIDFYNEFKKESKFYTRKLMHKYKFPLIKRKLMSKIFNTSLKQYKEVINYIKENTLYNVDLINNDIIAQQIPKTKDLTKENKHSLYKAVISVIKRAKK